MKKKILAICIFFCIFLCSFNAVGTHTENDCGCIYTNEQKNSIDEEKNIHYSTGVLGELYDTSSMGMSFMGNPPTTYNWKSVNSKDYTTSARNQGQCGSCYAFSVIGVVESLLDIHSLNPNRNMDLSEQYLVSCGSITYGMSGCGGAIYTPPPGMGNFISWTKDNDVVSESCFPYTSGGGTVPPCNSGCPKIADVSNWGWIDSTQINNIKNALITHGPLTASMLVYEDFYGYDGGIYEHTGGGSTGNHLVSIVGYDENQDYWICKNSWGIGWGEYGFFKIRYNNCEIQSHIAFVEMGYDDYDVDLTVQKYANQYYQKDDEWYSWGSHGMKCENIQIYTDDDYIYYSCSVPKDSPGPILIGIEFEADVSGANGGPDLEVKEPGGSWIKIKQSMGNPTDKIWKFYGITNDYISSSNELQFRILCAWGCNTYIDDVGVLYTENTPPDPIPNLDCDGNINGANIKPGAKVTGSFKVKNVGEPNSKLDWRVSDWPDWGSSWSFNPSSGNDLSEGSSKTIEVSFYAPDQSYKTFSGVITVVNNENPSDSDTVPVVVITPRANNYFGFFAIKLLEKLPILKAIFSNFNYLR